ncbi:LysM peptidoglycan-binding domain-containing protein [Indioceanicola profundi]|uniref:LysM peptidoglycan-binding domain-containing protein n=1 Tax=Indioceanicola profundi TaxID=2220096 RepID=UPI0013C4489D|nr:hypothetical protein [Indioceanicola profundi]
MAEISRGPDKASLPSIEETVAEVRKHLSQLDDRAAARIQEKVRANLWFGNPCLPLATEIARLSKADYAAPPSELLWSACNNLGLTIEELSGQDGGPDSQAGANADEAEASILSARTGLTDTGASDGAALPDPDTASMPAWTPILIGEAAAASADAAAEGEGGTAPVLFQPEATVLDDPAEMAASAMSKIEENDPLLEEEPPPACIGAGGVPAASTPSDAIRRITDELAQEVEAQATSVPNGVAPTDLPPQAGSGDNPVSTLTVDAAAPGPVPELTAPRRAWFARKGKTDPPAEANPAGPKRDPRALVALAVVLAVTAVFVVWPLMSGGVQTAASPSASRPTPEAQEAASPRQTEMDTAAALLPPSTTPKDAAVMDLLAEAAMSPRPAASGALPPGMTAQPRPEQPDNPPATLPVRTQEAQLSGQDSGPRAPEARVSAAPVVPPTPLEVPPSTTPSERTEPATAEDAASLPDTEIASLIEVVTAELKEEIAAQRHLMERQAAEIAGLRKEVSSLRQTPPAGSEAAGDPSAAAGTTGPHPLSSRAALGAIERDPETQRHYVRVIPGETLAEVAQRTGVSVIAIQRLNPEVAHALPYARLISGSLWIEPVSAVFERR